MKLNKHFYFFIALSSIFFKIMPVETLKNLCIREMLSKPRYHLQHTDLKLISQCLGNLKEDIRSYWFANLPQKNDDLYNKLLATNKKLSRITSGVKQFKFNKNHSKIKIYRERIDRDGLKHKFKEIYDFNGNCLFSESTFDIWLKTRPGFVSEGSPAFCDKKELEPWGFNVSQIKEVTKDNDGKRYIILYNDYFFSEGKLVKLELDKAFLFNNFIQNEDTALELIFLLETLKIAYKNKEKITLTPQEEKILDLIPSQFENAKQFLKQYDAKNSSILSNITDWFLK